MTTKQPELKDLESLSNRDIVKRYQAGSKAISPDIANLTTDQLRIKFQPDSNAGELSCLELLGHIADGEIGFTQRMRRVAAEINPKFEMWDENAFIQNDIYSANNASDFISLISAIRIFTGNWLYSLPDNQFNRAGLHPMKGEQSLRRILEYVTWHLEHHGWYLDRKTELLRK